MNTFIPPAKPLIGDEERAAVDRVLVSGGIAQGPEVAAFESEFGAHFTSGLECVATNSGTSGAHLGLLACGVGPGDEVIVPSFTFAATANSVALTGATPIFADIDPQTFCLDPNSVDALVTERTKGIFPVHLYGQPADMVRLQGVADKHGLRIYEDSAQAHGAAIHGKPVGTFGDFGMFSLYPTKNMTASEGGMDSCATPEIARMIRLLRNQGMEKRYENKVVGFNARMTDIHAAIGRVQLTKVDAWTKQRQENAAFFDANLAGVITPFVAPGATHVYHQYTIQVAADRDGFAKALADGYQVGTGVYYPIPNHELPSFGLSLDLPNTAVAAQQVLSLPVPPRSMMKRVNALSPLSMRSPRPVGDADKSCLWRFEFTIARSNHPACVFGDGPIKTATLVSKAIPSRTRQSFTSLPREVQLATNRQAAT